MFYVYTPFRAGLENVPHGQEVPLVSPMASRFCFNASGNRKLMTLQTIVIFRKF